MNLHGGSTVRGLSRPTAAMRKAIVLWPAVSLLASGPPAPETNQRPDRWTSAPQEQRQIHGMPGHRWKLQVDGLVRELQRAETPRRLATLLEAAALARAVGVGAKLDAAMQRAAAALARDASSAARESDLDLCRRRLSSLLTYYEATGNGAALAAARNLGDALSRNPHPVGPADLGAALLLEPACVLFRHTGERRQITQAVTRGLDQPSAPRILVRLLETGSVYRAGRATAEEILASLSGLVELHRLSGDPTFLKPALLGWEDITARRLYITGAVSSGGYFKDDGMLPGESGAAVGDAGAVAEWLRLNWQLFRLTGETRYADQIERTFYNHLPAAQHPSTGAVARYVPLLGRKRFEAEPGDAWASHALAMSLALSVVWGTLDGAPALALYVPGEARVTANHSDGPLEVRLKLETRFPEEGSATLAVNPSRPARFPLHLRVPSWCGRFTASVAGISFTGQAGRWLKLERSWQPGDQVAIRMEIAPSLAPGTGTYENCVAIVRGPQVLVLERAVNPELPSLHRAAPAALNPVRLTEAPGRLPRGWPGRQAYTLEGIASSGNGGRQSVTKTRLVLIPFADATEHRVWLPRPDRFPVGPVAVTAFGEESWSDAGEAEGSFADERADTYRTIRRNGAGEHWYAVEIERPAWIQQVVYRHGKLLANGGWFDTSQGKPRIQIKRTHDGPWETAATLESYPETTAARAPELYDGQPFEVRLPIPVEVVGVRIVGRPARAFSSCAELAAYAPPAGAITSLLKPSGGGVRIAEMKR